MTDIKRYASVGPHGTHPFVCPICGHSSRSTNVKIIYCSERCANIAFARRHYQRNRDRIIKANLARYHAKKGGKSKKS